MLLFDDIFNDTPYCVQLAHREGRKSSEEQFISKGSIAGPKTFTWCKDMIYINNNNNDNNNNNIISIYSGTSEKGTLWDQYKFE